MSVISKIKLLLKLKNKEYREAYAEEHVKTSIPIQIRALREQRGWTQGRLANEAKTTQTAISRIEDPNYGKLSLNTLYKLAAAFDVALLVKFVPFSRLIGEFKDVSPTALSAESFEQDLPSLELWAAEEIPQATPRTVYTSTSLSPTFATYDDELLNMFIEGKERTLVSTSTDQRISSNYVELKASRSTETIPSMFPPQATVIDYTSRLPF